MWARVATAGIALILAAALAACGGEVQGGQPSPGPVTINIPPPSPQPVVPPPDAHTCANAQVTAPADQAWTDTFGLWGVPAPPPRAKITTPMAGPAVHNLAGAAVSDTAAAAWAAALQRSMAVLTWTQAQLNDAFYTSALNPVADGPRAYPGLPATYQRLHLDGVVYHCFDANTRFGGVNLVRAVKPGPGVDEYAFVIQEQLAFKDLYIYKDGHTTPVWGPQFISNPQPKLRLIAGSLKTNATLGDVWYVTRDDLCTRRGDPGDPCQVYGVTPPG